MRQCVQRLIEIVCEDDDHLFALLNDKIRVVPGVRTTETFTYLELSRRTAGAGG